MKKILPVFVKDQLKIKYDTLVEFLISANLKSKIINDYKKNIPNISYSQEGEDLILKRILGYQINGFYIDIGAHHPTRFSNTKIFYDLGWNGINIDAMPGSMNEFKLQRTRDINLEIGISKERNTLKYFQFNEPALNTFSEKEAKLKDGKNGYKIIKENDIDTFPLAEILDKYEQYFEEIDFMNIDVEGLDLEVLKSNNWEKYKPKIILIESLNSSENWLDGNVIFDLLSIFNYKLVAKTHNTMFFKLSNYEV